MKLLRILFILLVAVFVVIQFFGIDKNNPQFDPNMDLITMEKPPMEIEKILKSTCYDCHSNETVWPWYSNIAPVSWMLKDHVEDGRHHLNFSNWGKMKLNDRAFKIEDIIEEMEDGEMPIPGYDLLHPDAKLSDDQKESLFKWLRSIQKIES